MFNVILGIILMAPVSTAVLENKTICQSYFVYQHVSPLNPETECNSTQFRALGRFGGCGEACGV